MRGFLIVIYYHTLGGNARRVRPRGMLGMLEERLAYALNNLQR